MVFSAMMYFSRILLLCSSLVASLVVVGRASAQNPPSSPEPKAGASRPEPQSRITIEVTGGDKETPVDTASVYFKYIEEHKIKKNKTMEWNVKTNREGIDNVPDAPLGRVPSQGSAEGR